jgi:ribosomal protein L11 methyltransferase
MSCYLFRLLDDYSVFAAKKELRSHGLHDLYVIEDDSSGEVLIGGIAKKIKINSIQTCLLVEKKKSVSWEDQWAQFAKDFRDGKAHINLEQFGASQTLLLLPGPGFGDLSHPSTYLMLELMSGCMKDETIFDLGCGSGILALAALMMGAKKANGIDIDPKALAHARKNAALNHLEKQARFSQKLPQLKAKPVVLINMILPEQRILIGENPALPKQAKLWLTSGILKSQRNETLSFLSGLGLKVIEEKERDEWLGFKIEPFSRKRMARK